MGLKEYWKKRDFEETAEPRGTVTSHKGDLRFVVQKHAASHLHYDFRLEVDGVLKSWAVPKGPSLNPADKRLAMQVEDHPFDYRTFEGTIPEGSYGAGTVIVWDEGTYTVPHSTSPAEAEKEMEKGLNNGRLTFILNGQKLKGEFALIRVGKGNGRQWLLIKKRDEYATTDDITLEDRSVLSDKTLQEIAGGGAPSKRQVSKSGGREKVKRVNKQTKEPVIEAARKIAMPKHVTPMLATLVEKPFNRPNWIFEIKWDGYRALAEIKNKKVQLYSRNQKTFTSRYKPVVDDLKHIDADVLLDGEIVVLDEKGRPSFQMVQNYQRDPREPLVYYVFDILYLNGEDLQQLPLRRRKEILQKLLPENLDHVRYCDHIEEYGKAFYKVASQHGFEGIIAKDAKSPYQQKRTHDWLKIKTHLRQEVIICGFTEPKGAREKFGALVLGVYDQNKLEYVGHTGSGFDRKKLTEIHVRLKPLIQKQCPFEEVPKTRSPATWVKPQLVCEVTFAEWTREGQMRQAIFLDFREDKKPEDVIREKITPVAQVLEEEETQKSAQPSRKKEVVPENKELTNLDKVYWPDEGYTKGDLIEYYRAVAPYILPYLKDRPETLHRFPNGIAKPGFFQKDVEQVPPGIRTAIVEHEDRDVNYLLIEDEKSLLYIINLGCIEIHPFNSRIQSLDRPDYMIIDLDPEDVKPDQIVEVAQMVRKVLQELGIDGYCKTSGGRGLHIYVPMDAQYTFEQVKQFAELIARFVHRRLPDLTSLERSPGKRQKRVYLDYLQNNYGQTVAAPYCVRPKPGAPVSTPLKWSEVQPGLDPTSFTIKTVLKRFKKMGDLFQPVLGQGIDMEACLKKIKE